MASDRLCVVTGATGAVGPAVTRRLARETATSVVVIARRAPEPDLLPPQVKFRSGDLVDPQTLELVRQADVVFHLAARLHVSDPDPALRAEYERVNVEATRRLADATGPSARFIMFSTIDVYGPTPPGTLATEETVANPRSLYGQTKLRAERIVLEHPGGTVLRLAAVYGPRVKANYARLARALARHRYLQVGPGENVRTLVFEEDVAEAAWLTTRAALPSRIYNVTDGTVHTLKQIVAAICDALGRRPPRWTLPAPIVRASAAVIDGLSKSVGRRSPVTPQMIDKMQENVGVSGDRLIRESAYRPAWNLARGWREVVRTMNAESTPRD